MPEKVLRIGGFEVTSTVLRVADPCYPRTDALAHMVAGAKPGAWTAFVEPWEWAGDPSAPRCGRVIVLHASVRSSGVHDWRRLPFTVPVDTGRVYVGGDAEFPCAEDLSSGRLAVMLPAAVVALSGTGDGEYAAYSLTDLHGEVVGVAVDFHRQAHEVPEAA